MPSCYCLNLINLSIINRHSAPNSELKSDFNIFVLFQKETHFDICPFHCPEPQKSFRRDSFMIELSAQETYF